MLPPPTCSDFTTCIEVTTATVLMLRETPVMTKGEEVTLLSSCASWENDVDEMMEMDDDLGGAGSWEGLETDI